MSWTTREEWLNHFVKRARPIFLEKGYELPEHIRVSIGWPFRGGRSKSIGECWASTASKDGSTAIFITPTMDGETDSYRLADILTHELCHAAVGIEAKHGPVFKKCATTMGLEGKMTATAAGKAWHEWAGPIIDEMGTLPHAQLAGGLTSAPKKQTTRMVKCECDTCGFLFRTAKKWLVESDDGEPPMLRCPDMNCDGTASIEMPEE